MKAPKRIFGYYKASPTQFAGRTGFARTNRKQMTEAEGRLWRFIQKDQVQGFRFRRQHVIGRFIVDFVCLAQRLIIEVDGGYHEQEEQRCYDLEREAELQGLGFRILRFSNEQVLYDIELVLDAIRTALP